MGLPPWQQVPGFRVIQALVSTILPPPSWDVGPGVRKQMHCNGSRLRTLPQLPVFIHPPPPVQQVPFCCKSSHSSVSLRTQGRTPSRRRPGRGFLLGGEGRMFWKTLWSWIDPTRKCRSIRPPAPMIIRVVAAGQGCPCVCRTGRPFPVCPTPGAPAVASDQPSLSFLEKHKPRNTPAWCGANRELNKCLYTLGI